MSLAAPNGRLADRQARAEPLAGPLAAIGDTLNSCFKTFILFTLNLLLFINDLYVKFVTFGPK